MSMLAMSLVAMFWAAQPAASTPEPGSPKAEPKVETKPQPAKPAVNWPHPMISEVLFAVPTGDGPAVDANKDGLREVSGDEFIEIINPHDRPIDLRGYVITDGAPNRKSTMRFVLPALMLPPRGVVVVFNGHESKIPGPVGDAKSAPRALNDHFHKAAVLSMKMASQRIAFSNAGDAACLKDPKGVPIQRVRWGKSDENAGGTGFALDEVAPTSGKGSVQREGIAKEAVWRAHTDIENGAFSPGAFAGFPVKEEKPASKP